MQYRYIEGNNMKIGIISEFNTETVNYGNHLQTYALNYYLRKHCNIEQVESLVLCGKQAKQYTNIFHPLTWKGKIKYIRLKHTLKTTDPSLIKERMIQFRNFREMHIPMRNDAVNAEALRNMDYDAFIVGSDVVWAQSAGSIYRTKFLDFTARKPFRRIAYAPSFANDYMPWWNMGFIRKYLKAFDAVSVREHSSVAALEKHGITGVQYCVDPTLLLTAQEWEALEQRPEGLAEDGRYLFAYILGRDPASREQLADLARRKGLVLVTVPHADRIYVPADVTLPGVKIDACSIENWLWMIHHAELVVTDSFHGTVFSTIFQRKFVVLKRVAETIDINNRMRDYLHQIGQEDKALPADRLEGADGLIWDYDQIGQAISVRRQNSIQFLKNALGD